MHASQDSRLPNLGPIVAPRGDSPALTSHPNQELDPRFQTYEANPVPWWVTVVWISFLAFGAIYLIVNLLE